MARLPQTGQDAGTWGNILNDFLLQAHDPDGSLKDGLLTADAVGLGEVDNTSDATKNSATATLTNKTISGASNTLTNIPQSAVTNLTTDLAGKLTAANNLSDLASTATARTNLGLGTAATMTTAQIAADSALTNAFLTNTRNKAYAILTGVPILADVYRLSSQAESLTVTLSAANASTSITNPVHRRPKRASMGGGTPVDITGDPLFAYEGVASGKINYGTVFPEDTYVRPNVLTGSVNSRWRPSYRWEYSGQAFEIRIVAKTTSLSYRLTIDGKRVTEDMQTTAIASGNTYLLKVDAGSVMHREWMFEMDDPNMFGGLLTEQTSTIRRPSPPPRGTFAVFGDSISEGSNDANSFSTWPTRLAQSLGFTSAINLSQGGTGYLANGTGTAFRNRIPDIVAANPTVLLIYGGYNDNGQTLSAIQTEAEFVVSSIKSQLPNTIILLGGCWSPGNPSASLQTINEGLKAAAASQSVQFIDTQDPLNVRNTAPAWAATTSYFPGDIVNRNGVVYTCISTHTSTGSFDTTRWRGTSWIHGTGRSGATTGDGNADVAISTDTVHPTLVGHKILEKMFYAAVLNALRTIAAS